MPVRDTNSLVLSSKRRGHVKVRIRQHDAPLDVRPGETVLEAALRRGLRYPHGCKQGNCGSCKSRLLAGRVDLKPYSPLALSDAEREDGLILACRARPETPVEVAWLAHMSSEADEAPRHPMQHLVCRVVSVEPATRDITVVRLAPLDGGHFAFSAGQYAAVTFAGQAPRDYSMANRPDQAELEFHIRAVANGATSLFVARDLRAGSTAVVDGPFGRCWLRDHHPGPLLAIAGGSGLAPLRSIVDTALRRGVRQPIHLYFGARDEADVYGEDELRDLAARHRNLHLAVVLSAPRTPTDRRTGPLHAAVAADFTTLVDATAYLAGPPDMVAAVREALRGLGVANSAIHADPFHSAEEMLAGPDAAPDP